MREWTMVEEVPQLAEMIAAAFARGEGARAVEFEGTWYDWAWMRRTADRVLALLDEAGLREDQAIAIAPANTPACATTLLGLIAANREIVMIYAYQTPEALAKKVRELNCAAVLAEDKAWEAPMREAAAACGAVGITLGLERQEIVPGTAVDGAREHRVAGARRGINLLTSGTTGPPKLRHADYELLKTSMILQSATHPYGVPAPPQPAWFASAFGNISGLYSWLPLVVANRPVIMRPKFNLDDYLVYLKTYRPASAGIPPSGFRELIDRNEPKETFAGIRYMAAGASAMDADLQRQVEETYEVKILHAYGATEFGGVITMNTPQLLEAFGGEKSFSVGKPIGGVQLKIVDPETGADLPPDTPGVLHVQVPRVGPEWMETSDLCKLDADGFLWYVGRNDGAIVRGGFKIDPVAVRNALLTHPAIFDAIVAGAPDRRLGEVPVAAYVVRKGVAAPSLDELKAHMRAHLPATFLPTAYRQVDELPYTPTNKQDLAAVRAMFAAGDD
ncbi:class I adenylate-forming enzyme family protein [Novosphingobium bradum]|uniref:Class I adenylate-forming enzyme family protein n=1 Tax=Novosphingobium bradum TaxID=1737444 RepID=A0ABV7INV2_9SPHN